MTPIQPRDLGFGPLFWRVPDAIVVGDIGTGRIALWNPAAETLFGYTASEAVDLSLEVLVPAPLKESHRRGLATYRTTGQGPLIDGATPVEVPALHRSGNEIWIELTLSPIGSSDLESNYVLAVIRDVTARKRAEDRARSLTDGLERHVQERTAALEAISAERAAILQQMADGVMLLSGDARVVFMNVEAQRLFGIDSVADQVDVHVRLGQVVVIEEDNLSWPNSSVGRAIFEGHAVMDAEQSIQRADGSRVSLAVSATPIVGPQGGRLGMVASFRDVTVRHQLDQQKATFLSAAAHDLKTPLTSIKGLSQLLRRRVARLGGADAVSIVEGFEKIDAIVNRMTNQVNELLDVSGAHMGQPVALNRTSTDLVALVNHIVSDVQHYAERSRITVTSTPKSLQGMWDADRIHRALGNIVINAVKYSSGTTPITIAIRRLPAPSRSADGCAEVEVRDEGIGIPAADLPHVLEPFYRAHNVETRTPGTGVGLAGAKQIIERHGGSISIDSQEGHGTTVTVHLPLSGSSDAHAEMIRSP